MNYLSNPALQNYAVGGMVRGPGTGTSDSIDAKLSDGEFIMPADVVRHYGTDKLNKMVEAVGGMRQPIENKDGVIHAAQKQLQANVSSFSPSAEELATQARPTPEYTAPRPAPNTAARPFAPLAAAETAAMPKPVVQPSYATAASPGELWGQAKQAVGEMSRPTWGGIKSSLGEMGGAAATNAALAQTMINNPVLAEQRGQGIARARGLAGISPDAKLYGTPVVQQTQVDQPPNVLPSQQAGFNSDAATYPYKGVSSAESFNARTSELQTPTASTVATSGMTKSAPPMPAGAVDLGGGNYIAGNMAPGADVGYMKSAMTPSTPEQLANRARDVDVVAQRHAASEAWDRDHAPGGMGKPMDYDSQINQLIAQSQETGDPNNWDSMMAAQSRRHAAQNTLQSMTALRGQDINAQSERERTAQAQANLMTEREMGRGTAEREQKNKDRAYKENVLQFDAGQTAAAQKETNRLGEVGTKETADKTALALTASQTEGQAEAYLRGKGYRLDEKGNIVKAKGTWFDPSDEVVSTYLGMKHGGKGPKPK